MANRVSEVNKALRDSGIDAKLLRGRGYYYFVGPAVAGCYSASVMVYRAEDLTVADWLDEFHGLQDRI